MEELEPFLMKVDELHPRTGNCPPMVKVVQKGHADSPQVHEMPNAECLVGDETAKIMFAASNTQGVSVHQIYFFKPRLFRENTKLDALKKKIEDLKQKTHQALMNLRMCKDRLLAKLDKVQDFVFNFELCSSWKERIVEDLEKSLDKLKMDKQWYFLCTLYMRRETNDLRDIYLKMDSLDERVSLILDKIDSIERKLENQKDVAIGGHWDLSSSICLLEDQIQLFKELSVDEKEEEKEEECFRLHVEGIVYQCVLDYIDANIVKILRECKEDLLKMHDLEEEYNAVKKEEDKLHSNCFEFPSVKFATGMKGLAGYEEQSCMQVDTFMKRWNHDKVFRRDYVEAKRKDEERRQRVIKDDNLIKGLFRLMDN